MHPTNAFELLVWPMMFWTMAWIGSLAAIGWIDQQAGRYLARRDRERPRRWDEPRPDPARADRSGRPRSRGGISGFSH